MKATALALCDLRCMHPECARFRAEVRAALRNTFGIEPTIDERNANDADGRHASADRYVEQACTDCGTKFMRSPLGTNRVRCDSCWRVHYRMKHREYSKAKRRREAEREAVR